MVFLKVTGTDGYKSIFPLERISVIDETEKGCVIFLTDGRVIDSITSLETLLAMLEGVVCL
jgi:hypothetical protein